jgi:hypothetical protein
VTARQRRDNQLARVTSGRCEAYLRAWRADRASWQRHVELLPTRQQRTPALEALSRRGSARLNWQQGASV